MKVRLILATMVFGFCFVTGCDTGSSGGSTHTTVYYGTGLYDPWYYNGCYDCDHDDKVVINPPPASPDRDWGARPSHPIAEPPGRGDWGGGGGRPSVSPRPTPSIPSTPRPTARSRGR